MEVSIVAVAALVLVAVVGLGWLLATQRSTEARDLPRCGPQTRLPCLAERDDGVRVVAAGEDGERVAVPPAVYDERLAERVNRGPRPCFSGEMAC